MPSPVLELRDIRKDYRGLRPLRLESLTLHEGQGMALTGFDATTAEVLVNLITGAIVPDTGSVHVFGQSTADIADADAWLATLDHFGILSERAVLLEGFSVEQNLALPLSIGITDLSPETRSAVIRLAEEVGLSAERLPLPVAQLQPAERIRLRLGRALALDPRVLLAEHPNATLEDEELDAFAVDLGRIVATRGVACLVLTADDRFAGRVFSDVLTLHPGSGALRNRTGWRRLLP